MSQFFFVILAGLLPDVHKEHILLSLTKKKQEAIIHFPVFISTYSCIYTQYMFGI